MTETAYTLRIRLAAPIWAAAPMPIMVDGLLLAAAARYAFGDQALWRTPDAPGWVEDLPLPLAKSHGVWHLAMPQFPFGGVADSGVAVKRPDVRVADPSGKQMVPGSGPLRQAFLTPTLWTIPEMTCDLDTDGDPAALPYLQELLALLPDMGIGGWRRQGYGRIRDVVLEPRTTGGSALFTADGQPRRPIPLDTLPADWEPDWTVTTVMPYVPNPPRVMQPAVLCAMPAPSTWWPPRPTKEAVS